MERLILITEGYAHMVEYFHRNKVYPNAVVFKADNFKELSPYLTAEDEILVVIKGATDFTLAEIYALLNNLDEVRDKVKDITIMSNLYLGKIPHSYVLYEGDLFYGGIKNVKNGKVEVTSEDEDGERKKKGLFSFKRKKSDKSLKSKDSNSNNAVMQRYKKYNNRSVNCLIYGMESRKVEEYSEGDNLAQKIINIDLFKDESKN